MTHSENIKVIYPTKPEFATDYRGNKIPLLYTTEENIYPLYENYPLYEKRVLKLFKKYNIDIDYKDDDTFADWLSCSHEEGLFDEWDVYELQDLFLLQWMTDVIAGSPNPTYTVIKSPNPTYTVIKREVYDRK
jgi:hypothetical protein